MARDPETRRRSREAQNLRRKLQRRAKRLQAQAKLEKDEGIKQVYRREAKNINEAVRRSAFKRGESDTKKTQKFQRLLDLNDSVTVIFSFKAKCAERWTNSSRSSGLQAKAVLR